MDDVLTQILSARRGRVQAAKEQISIDELDRMIKKNPPPLNFKSALMKDKKRIGIIAELKRRSPSAGELRPDYRVPAIAMAYKNGGADACSVLTEPVFFGGGLADMTLVKEATQLPILQKDFLFDFYQVVEARAHGADAILFIADMLDAVLLDELTACASEYKLHTLVEVFSASVMEAALQTGSELIGINTRNLRTLEMIPDNVERLSKLVPPDRLLVAESGIKTPADIKKMKSIPVQAVLVGESLLKQDDLEKAVRALKEAS